MLENIVVVIPVYGNHVNIVPAFGDEVVPPFVLPGGPGLGHKGIGPVLESLVVGLGAESEVFLPDALPERTVSALLVAGHLDVPATVDAEDNVRILGLHCLGIDIGKSTVLPGRHHRVPIGLVADFPIFDLVSLLLAVAYPLGSLPGSSLDIPLEIPGLGIDNEKRFRTHPAAECHELVEVTLGSAFFVRKHGRVVQCIGAPMEIVRNCTSRIPQHCAGQLLQGFFNASIRKGCVILNPEKKVRAPEKRAHLRHGFVRTNDDVGIILRSLAGHKPGYGQDCRQNDSVDSHSL